MSTCVLIVRRQRDFLFRWSRLIPVALVPPQGCCRMAAAENGAGRKAQKDLPSPISCLNVCYPFQFWPPASRVSCKNRKLKRLNLTSMFEFAFCVIIAFFKLVFYTCKLQINKRVRCKIILRTTRALSSENYFSIVLLCQKNQVTFHVFCPERLLFWLN